MAIKPTLTVTSQTNLQELQKFAQDVKTAKHGQVRAREIKNKDGTTTYQLYSKSQSSKASRWLGWNQSKQQTKAELTQSLIKQIFKNVDPNGNTVLGDIFQRRMPSNSKSTVSSGHLQNLMMGLEDASSRPIPMHDRQQIMVGMGQGTVGPLNQLQFYSDSFQSCAPLVMWNSNTGMGGLFHIPAFSEDEMPEGMQKAISEMIDRIKPTNVEIHRGYDVEAGVHDGFGVLGDTYRRQELQQEKVTETTLATLCKGLDTTISKTQKGVQSILITQENDGTVLTETNSNTQSFGFKGLVNAFKKDEMPGNAMLVDMQIPGAKHGLQPFSRLR